MRLLLDPNSEPGTGAPSESAPSSAPTPVSEPTSAQTGGDAGFSPRDFGPESTPSTTPVAPPPSQLQSTPEWVGVRDFAQQRGVDLSAYGDDEAALNYLMGVAQRSRESDMYAQLGRQLAPHSAQIQQYLQQQQQPQQPQQPDYQPPQWDDRWLSMVEQDPATGLVYGKPGTPPHIVDTVNKRISWQREFNNNPIGVFDKHLQSQVPSLVERLVNERMAQHTQQQAVDSIIRDNSQWLYAKDPSGNMLRGPNGYVPTPEGQLYIQNLQFLARSGVTDPRVQDHLAKRLTFLPQQPQTPPTTQRATGSPNRNAAQVNQAATGTPQNGTVEQSNDGLSLYEIMKREMDAAGVTDADFAFEG